MTFQSGRFRGQTYFVQAIKTRFFLCMEAKVFIGRKVSVSLGAVRFYFRVIVLSGDNRALLLFVRKILVSSFESIVLLF